MSGGRELGRRGSPPRVRGEVQRQSKEKVKIGITPACAGRSPVSDGSSVPEKDHPRVCGEKSTMI